MSFVRTTIVVFALVIAARAVSTLSMYAHIV